MKRITRLVPTHRPVPPERAVPPHPVGVPGRFCCRATGLRNHV